MAHVRCAGITPYGRCPAEVYVRPRTDPFRPVYCDMHKPARGPGVGVEFGCGHRFVVPSSLVVSPAVERILRRMA